MAEFVGQKNGLGWNIQKTNNGHYRWQHTESGEITFTPSTPSDMRAIKNAMADVRRIERGVRRSVPRG